VIVAAVIVSGLDVALIAPDEVRVDRPFLALAVISNAGPARLEEAQVRLAYDRQGLRSFTPAARRLGTVQPSRRRWALWLLEAKAPGDFVLVAHAEARDGATGDVVQAESRAVVVHAR
jgi:hypothetical protein